MVSQSSTWVSWGNGGKIAGDARKVLAKKTGKKIVNPNNFLKTIGNE